MCFFQVRQKKKKKDVSCLPQQSQGNKTYCQKKKTVVNLKSSLSVIYFVSFVTFEEVL